jgi:hypothetical protein
MAEFELLYWLVVAGLAVGLVLSLAALARARRRERRAQLEASELRGMALDPVGARLVRLDMELERLNK